MASLIPWRKRKGGLPFAGPFGSRDDFPFYPFYLSRMRDEFDRLIERFSREFPVAFESDGWRWGLEVDDQDNAVVVRAEAPGFEPGDFNVQVTDSTLSLRASRKTETKKKDSKETETVERECYDTIVLPPGIDANKVEARYQNGVLTVTLPKTAAAKPKKIAVASS